MQRPANIKDQKILAYIEYLESRLKLFTSSPYCDSYMSIKRMVDQGNRQLIEASETTINFDSDQFKAIQKFVLLQKEYSDQLDYFRNKMTPLEQAEVDEQMKKGAGIAEKLALKNGER